MFTKPLGLELDHEKAVTQLENFKDLKLVERRADLKMNAAVRGSSNGCTQICLGLLAKP